MTQLCKNLVLANTSSVIWRITVRPLKRQTAYRCEGSFFFKDRKSFFAAFGSHSSVGESTVEIMIWGILGNVVYSADPCRWQTQALFVIRLHSPEARTLSRYFVKSSQVMCLYISVRCVAENLILNCSRRGTACLKRAGVILTNVVFIFIFFLQFWGGFISTGIPDNCVTGSQIVSFYVEFALIMHCIRYRQLFK